MDLGKLTELKAEDLMEGETILWTALQSWYVFIKNVLLVVILVPASFFITLYILFTGGNLLFLSLPVLFLMASAFLSIETIISRYTTRYYITTDRVLARHGLFSKHIDAVQYSKVQNIELHKSFYESIADIGDIYIDVAGGSGVELKIDNVQDPEVPHGLILKLMRKREMRGVSDGL